PPYEMSLVFTDSETVQRLNRDYRGVDESTDVLAFYMLPQHGADADFVSPPDDITHLGEVIISYPKTEEQAKEQGHSTEQELTLLIIHGILHLLGYDHEKPEEEAKMKAREKELLEGRHPMVERSLGSDNFIPNDTYLCNSDSQLIILTGPNMSGKSTYLKQVALTVLLAQIGSFVPARSARISIIDRIFTRIGAQEDLAAGQSTFMVEMTETANILHNATPRSLLILDEIGRGTSTYDGLSIA
ncbi:unnamed protein product, partial [marine sediment metagenome]